MEEGGPEGVAKGGREVLSNTRIMYLWCIDCT